MQRLFSFYCKAADDYHTWVFRLLKNIEKSQGKLLQLGIDEKMLSLKTWRVC